MDIMFWKNIIDLGATEAVIRQNFKLEFFNQVFEHETSLFHYFADNQDVIQLIQQKYLNAVNSGNITPNIEYLPLVMLNRDIYGMTALDWAVRN